MSIVKSLIYLSACFATVSMTAGAEKKNDKANDKANEKHRVETIDYGGFIAGSFVCHPKATYDNNTGIYALGDGFADSVAKGVVVLFGDNMDNGAIFDLDTQRIACAWTGGMPRLIGWWLNGKHGPTSQLTQLPMFATKGVGWANPDGSFVDPRADIVKPLPPPGPLPRAWSHSNGYYRHGRETIFSYDVAGTAVLELLSLQKQDTAAAIARTFTIAAHAKPLTVVLAEANGPEAKNDGVVSGGDPRAALASAPEGSVISVRDGRLILTLPAASAVTNVTVLVAGKEAESATLTKLANATPKPSDLMQKTKGGPALWKETLETVGTLGKDIGGFAVDSIGLPETNPWQAWVRPTGMDFFADGTTAAVATLNGDIFIVSGIDAELKKLTWRRFAAGMHAPLGVKIVDGLIHVACRDGIVRLHDLDKDGEADYYHMFTMDLLQTPSFHSFVCDLNTDASGNFVFSVGGAIRAGGRGFQLLTPHMGAVLKLTKDGKTLTSYASGLRMPNGSAVRSDGQITVSDNEGVWVPASPIHWVKEGDFLGVKNTAHGKETHHPQPICFMPQRTESSACSQVWVTSDKWAPFKDDLLHMSYGKSGLFKVYMEEIDGVMQGGVIRFPIQLTSAGVRGRFNPVDGQLYVVGLGMGQTTAVKTGGFDRVRTTGTPVRMGRSLGVVPNGVRLTFTAKLDPATAADPSNYSIKQWNYRWTENYGSSAYSVDNPEKKTDGDIVVITKATLSADGLSVVLEVPGIKPVMQFAVSCKVGTADGELISTEFMSTIHKVPAK